MTPAALGTPASLVTLRLSGNRLTGRLPEELARSADALRRLEVAGNRLDPGEGLAAWMRLDRCVRS